MPWAWPTDPPRDEDTEHPEDAELDKVPQPCYPQSTFAREVNLVAPSRKTKAGVAP